MTDQEIYDALWRQMRATQEEAIDAKWRMDRALQKAARIDVALEEILPLRTPTDSDPEAP